LHDLAIDVGVPITDQATYSPREYATHLTPTQDSGMASTSDFGGFDFRDALPSPPLPPSSAAFIPADLANKAPGAFQIYAAAWTMAHRDHELDKLFNAEFFGK
jgi:hypothetical protein